MKIAIIGTFPPYRGGIAHFNQLLLSHLRRNHRVIPINFLRQYPDFLFPGSTQMMERRAFPAEAFPLLDSINPVTWVKTFHFLKSGNFDLVIYKYWMPFFAPSLGSISFLGNRTIRYRTLAILDNLTPHEPKPGDRLLNRFFCKNTDFFIVMSRAVEQDLLSIKPGAKYRFAHHPLYTNFGEPISKERARKRLGIEEDNVILYFGYIRKYKGVRYLIRAVPLILKEMNVRTVIAGEFYDDPSPYLRELKASGAEAKINLENTFIPDEKVRDYFCAADLIVLPYVSATQSGIVKIALSYNRPCLVTDVGGLPEIVHHGETGFVVPPENPQAIAEAVIAFFRETDRQRMEKNLEKEKSRYSWMAFVDAIEELTGA